MHDMRADELDFQLPSELIAQVPAPNRAASRMLHYRRDDRSITHRTFSDLPTLLRAGDLLVFNDARVIPAKFMLQKLTGGRVEGLFLGERDIGRWDVLLRNLGGACANTVLKFAQLPEVHARVLEVGEAGQYLLAIDINDPASVFLDLVGRMPLPPYIKRAKDADERDDFDRERYQTVYAKAPGAVAAPTAGLHFTAEILEELMQKGVESVFVTLHVGMGTFKPVTSDELSQHAMHSETYTVDETAAVALTRAKREGRRIIAVGTTSARVLESQPFGDSFEPRSVSTSIFIYPPYQWKHVSAMVTNFHLPRSTLIAMIAALIGLDEQRRVYAEAIAEQYRFFSYGDAMFIE